jgi:hypothetical protein
VLGQGVHQPVLIAKRLELNPVPKVVILYVTLVRLIIESCHGHDEKLQAVR